MDLSLNVKKTTTVEEINKVIHEASLGNLKGLVGYTEEPHASVDFNNDPRSSIFDGSQTKVCGNTLIKIFCWFDNEWGFANRMLDVSSKWLSL